MASVFDQDPDSLLRRLRELPSARPVLRRLAGLRQDVYLVGGAVRDLMIGAEPVDLDLIVDGPLEPVAAQLGAPLRSHDRFGTGSLEIDGFRYDLARTRTETYERPGALPTVRPGSLEQDLARRDFTVNAVLLGPVGGVGMVGGVGGVGSTPCRLAAFGTALEDIDQGRLRVLHEASFSDDPTRLLRLARYQSRLGFEIEGHTLELAATALRDGALDTVSGARIGSELWLLAQEAKPLGALRTLTELGLGEALARGFGLSDAGSEMAAQALDVLPPDGDRAVLALAAAALALPVAELDGLLRRLALPAGERDRILAAARATELATRLAAAHSPSEIAVAAADAPPEAVALAGALGPMAPARHWLEDLRGVGLEITGDDLIRAGLRPGPAIGRALRAALAAKLDGRAQGRDSELAAALAGAGDRPPPERGPGPS